MDIEEILKQQREMEEQLRKLLREDFKTYSNKEVMYEYISTSTKYLEPSEILIAMQDKPENLMEEEDYEFYKSLPDTVTIYRGMSRDELEECDDVMGISWSIEYSVAEFFAARMPKKYNPIVVKAVVPKSRIKFATMRRNEFEVLVEWVDDFEIVQDEFDGFDFDRFREEMDKKAESLSLSL